MSTRKIRSLEDLAFVAQRADHILTLFSGGLDSSYVLKVLAEQGCKVTALSVDMGEGGLTEDLFDIAHAFGAQLEIIDARQRFCLQGVLPAIRAQAKYMGLYPVSSSLSRPVLAQCAVETARRLGCQAIVHTANQSQNSLRRLNGSIAQLGFEGWFGTPYEFSALTREEKIQSFVDSGVTRFEQRGVSGDANLWCREFESGALDNPESFWMPESLYKWTAPGNMAAFSKHIMLDFEEGIPVALDGESLPPLEIIARLNRHVGAFGIGRYCGLEHLDAGEKVLEIREAPAATVLMEAYRHLETATLDAELLREKKTQEQLWVREAIEGRWFGLLREAADAFITRTAQRVSGTVSFALRAGTADMCCLRAQRALYLTNRDEWEKTIARSRSTLSLQTLQASNPKAHV